MLPKMKLFQILLRNPSHQSAPSQNVNMASPHVPLLYRVLFLYIDPLLSTTGIIFPLFQPAFFMTSLAPRTTADIYHPKTEVVYTNLAALYFFVTFVAAVIPRISADLKVWKTLIWGIVGCDLIMLYGNYRHMGSELFTQPGLWNSSEWTNNGILLGFGVIRVAFLMGIGIKTKEKGV